MIVLAILSLAIVFLPKSWLVYSFTLDHKSLPTLLMKDSKGDTKVSWLDKQAQAWSCTLDMDYQNSYCSLLLTVLDERWQGIDLSRFDQMRVRLNYKGEMKTLRVYLRNRHPRYFTANDEMSTKYNMVEISLSENVTDIAFDMKNFKTADWWIAQRNIPPKESYPEFNDIIYIEFQTGTRNNKEKYSENIIQVEEISWKGQLITDELLYRILAAIWIVVIIYRIIQKTAELSSQLRKNQRYQEELKSINKLLNVKKEQLEAQAKTDHLTGILNRLGIRQILIEGFKSWKEKRIPFSLIIVDLDHFKNINDTYGHDIGDKILIACAEVLKEKTNSDIFASRWGGEEFLIACKNTELESAREIAETLRITLQNKSLDRGIKITASFGVSSLEVPFLTNAFKDADEALYRAKSWGRNQVVTADQMVSPHNTRSKEEA